MAFFDVPLGPLDGVLFVLATVGLGISRAADTQRDRFMRENAARAARGEAKVPVLDTGVWRHSRHVNYFGEQAAFEAYRKKTSVWIPWRVRDPAPSVAEPGERLG